MNIVPNIFKVAVLVSASTITVSTHAFDKVLSKMEQSNLEKALYCMNILENSPSLKPSNRIHILKNECFDEHYIQHSPHVSDGRDAVLSIFVKRYKNTPNLTTSIKRTASEGDLVWIHQHVKKTPDDLGRAVINIFRMKNGKFVEHWNVGQAVPKHSKNNNTMF